MIYIHVYIYILLIVTLLMMKIPVEYLFSLNEPVIRYVNVISY